MNIDPAASSLATRGVAFAPAIAAAARRHGVDATLLAAVAAQETGGPGSNAGRNIVGDGGHGRGLFQIDDRWHDFAKTADAMNPARNADYAAGMLSGLLARYGGNVHEALSAYNAGSPTATGTTTRWGDGSRLGYADSVLRHRDLIGAPPSMPESGTQSPGAGGSVLQSLLPFLGAGQMAAPPPYQPQPYQSQPYQPQTTDYSGVIDNDGDDA
jgi:hypothetical protein